MLVELSVRLLVHGVIANNEVDGRVALESVAYVRCEDRKMERKWIGKLLRWGLAQLIMDFAH